MPGWYDRMSYPTPYQKMEQLTNARDVPFYKQEVYDMIVDPTEEYRSMNVMSAPDESPIEVEERIIPIVPAIIGGVLGAVLEGAIVAGIGAISTAITGDGFVKG